MFGLQPVHLIFIVIIGLLVLGPSRFGDLGRSLGATIKEFRSATKEPAESDQEKS